MTDQTSIVPIIRRDGWTPARKAQFLDHLAHEGSVRTASGRIGVSREAAYQLRRRDALFARAWNAALVLAREAGAEVLETRAIHGVEEEIWFRGELVGTRRKYDSRLLLAHMARLDKIAEDSQAGRDAARFDELLAVVGGVPVPDGRECDGEGLPLDRDDQMEIAAEEAEIAFVEAREAADGEEDEEDEEADAADMDARADGEVARYRACDEALGEEKWRASVAAGAACDQWRAQAHGAVDRLLAEPLAVAGTVSGVSGVSTSSARSAAADIAEGYAAINPLNNTYARA